MGFKEMMSSPKWKTAQGLGTLPAITAGIDTLMGSKVGETVSQISGTVDGVLNLIPESVKSTVLPLGGALSAGLLSNQVMNDLDIQNKWVKYGVNGVAALSGYAAGTAAAPYLIAASVGYALGKPTWKYGKEIVKRLGKTVGGSVAETANSSINLLTAPLRGIYSGLIKDTLLIPSPIKAVKKSVSN